MHKRKKNSDTKKRRTSKVTKPSVRQMNRYVRGKVVDRRPHSSVSSR